MTALLQSSARRTWSVDCESYLIRPGCVAPKLVCVSHAQGNRVGEVVSYDTDAAVRMRLVSEEIGERRVGLLAPREGLELVRQKLVDPGVVTVGHHVFYDLGVFAAEDPSLAVGKDAPIWLAFDDGRVRCTVIRQKMIDNATGELKYLEDEDTGDFKEQDFSLDGLVRRHFGRSLKKGGKCSGKCVGGHLATCFAFDCQGCCDQGCEVSYRLRYGILAQRPIAEWPAPARDYACGDAVETLELHDFQESLVLPEGIPGEVSEMQAAWALNLMSIWGVRTDRIAVEKLKAELELEGVKWFKLANGQREVTPGSDIWQRDPLGTRFLRDDGSMDRKAVQAAVVRAFAQLGEKVPMTDPSDSFPEGQVQTDKFTLKRSRHPGLRALYEFKSIEKILSTYVPVLMAGTEHPIHASYNPILETFRTSCVAQGSLVETVRDVSRAPKGTPIEDVRTGDLVYAYDADKKLVIRRVTWAGQTGVRKVKRLHWRGGRGGGGTRGHVDLTADHLVRLTSGEYKAAGELQPGDRVMALKRGTSNGYARLWPTGAPEITREHRFIYEQLTGSSPEHVHHDNENKLDNRVENLVGMTTADHLSLHSHNPSDALRTKRGKTMRRRWQDDREKMLEAQPRGEEHQGFRGFTSEQITELLWKHQGRPTLVAKELGTDYETLMRYMQAHDVKYLDIARQFTAHGEHITPELVKKWCKIEGKTVKAKLKEIGLGYYRWREVQEQFGHVPNNHVITMVEDLSDEVPVYDLTVDDVENFIVNEVCVHNCARPNMQNPPRKGGVRACYVPRDGWIYVSCDYDTLEMRALAQVCFEMFGYSSLRDALNAGMDPHVALAADILGLAYDEALKRYLDGDPELDDARQASKPGNFGFPGGMGWRAFMNYALKSYDVEVTEEQAKKLHKAFRERWTEMVDYFNFCSSLCGEHRAERIVFPMSNQVRGKVGYTQICNGWFQHRAAKGAKDALYEVSRECYTGHKRDGSPSPLAGSRPVIFMHDEIITEVPYRGREQEASDAADRIGEIMRERMRRWLPDVQVKASPVMMRRWFKGAKPVRIDKRLVPSRGVKEEVPGKIDRKTGKPLVLTKWVADLAPEEMHAA